MSDPDFERLNASKAPAPSDEARERAFAAAMDAFDQTNRQKSSAPVKGSRERARHTSANPRRASSRTWASSPSWAWRMIMQNRIAIGGIAACVIAVPMAAVLFTQQTQQPFGSAAVVEPQKPAGDMAARQDPSAAKEEKARSLAEAERSAEAALPPPPPAVAAKPAPQSMGRSAPQDAVQELGAVGVQELGAVGGYAPGRAELSRRAAESARIAPGVVAPAPADIRQPESGRDRFASAQANGLKTTAQDPVSTFSIDADTASYSWVRRALMQGRAPSPNEVRVEELINYFPYDYAAPTSAETPFRPTISVYPSPWNPGARIVHLGIKGLGSQVTARPKANLVFLVDVSGSMSAQDKLPLVKTSLKLLLDKLSSDDSVAIVTYAGGVGVALEPTKASDRDAITAAINRMQAGGSTAGAAGIEEAYRLARKNFDADGVNRVMLATDGDFNVGLSDDDGLQRLVERERKSGVFLSVLGFGQGNYNDALMQRLAQNGNGTAAYIDQLEEAQKVLSEEATSTLFPIAKDVKIQVEFNPATVAEYRLIGYETRALKREDFKDDKVDAGEIGSGAAVTALYEIIPVGSSARMTDDLRYAPKPPAASGASEDYGFLKLRYKLPNENASREIGQPIGKAQETLSLAGASNDVRFAAAVAAFGQKLRGDRQLSGMRWDEISALASGARGEDPFGYRAGFTRLVGLAKAVVGE